jgi:hypothetical protein
MDSGGGGVLIVSCRAVGMGMKDYSVIGGEIMLCICVPVIDMRALS